MLVFLLNSWLALHGLWISSFSQHADSVVSIAFHRRQRAWRKFGPYFQLNSVRVEIYIPFLRFLGSSAKHNQATLLRWALGEFISGTVDNRVTPKLLGYTRTSPIFVDALIYLPVLAAKSIRFPDRVYFVLMCIIGQFLGVPFVHPEFIALFVSGRLNARGTRWRKKEQGRTNFWWLLPWNFLAKSRIFFMSIFCERRSQVVG